jgi:hypothetical protein
MSYSWSDFDALAGWLAENRPDEASQRSAISRAYYYAYHRAAEYVSANGLGPETDYISHHEVWSAIRDSGRAGCRVLADRGFSLRNVRNWADYRLHFPTNLQKQAIDAIAEARDIARLIDTL